MGISRKDACHSVDQVAALTITHYGRLHAYLVKGNVNHAETTRPTNVQEKAWYISNKRTYFDYSL